MAAIRLKWSSLLHLTELEFIPEPPKVLEVSDELSQTLSWLTGATRHDRRLLRCDENGALLVADAWSLFTAVDTGELHPVKNLPKTYEPGVDNKGVLVATSTKIVLIDFYREDTADYERLYVPPVYYYFYPHKIFKAIVATVPYASGDSSYVGMTAFN